MASTSVNVGSGFNVTPSKEIILTAQSDLSIVRISFVIPLVLLSAAVAGYLLHLPIDRDVQFALTAFASALAFGGIIFVFGMYEALSKAV